MPKNQGQQGKTAIGSKYQPLYSSRLLADASSGDVLFFGYKVGDTVDGVTATKWHTNMSTPGTLPTKEGMRVYGLKVKLIFPSTAAAKGGVATDDVLSIMNSQSVLTLTRGDNDALTLPLDEFTAGSGIVYSGTEADVASVSYGVADPRAIVKWAPYFWDFDAGRPLVVTVRLNVALKLTQSTWMRITLEGPMTGPKGE